MTQNMNLIKTYILRHGAYLTKYRDNLSLQVTRCVLALKWPISIKLYNRTSGLVNPVRCCFVRPVPLVVHSSSIDIHELSFLASLPVVTRPPEMS